MEIKHIIELSDKELLALRIICQFTFDEINKIYKDLDLEKGSEFHFLGFECDDSVLAYELAKRLA